MSYYVYIIASRPGGAIYIGVTNNLPKRIYEHKAKLADGFSKKYGIDKLVYFECHDEIEQAIIREKRIKAWKRSMKNDLIEKQNPLWEDLYENICR